MIRQPSTMRQLYGWHRDFLAGRDVDMIDGEAWCGWYKRRMVKGGPWVPVRIFVERDIDPETGELTCDERLAMEIEGIRSDKSPEDEFSWLTPISVEEFNHLVDYRLRDTRMLDPYQRIDLSERPTLPQGVF